MKVDSTEFNKYLFLKEALGFHQDGIDYGKVIAADLLNLAYRNNIALHVFYKGLLVNLFTTLEVSSLKQTFRQRKVLATSFINRSDYDELVLSSIGGLANTEFVPLVNLKRRFVFSPVRILKTSYLIFRSPKPKLSFKERLYISSRIIYYKNVAESLEKVFQDFQLTDKRYLAFNSSYNLENLLTQFFIKKKVQCFSLSHGLSYISYKQKIPRDKINGENISAEKVFVWGESSRRNLRTNFNFPDSQIIVGGNPKYPLKPVSVKQTFLSGIVLLGRFIYEKGNKEILKIVSQLACEQNIKFHVKLHPTLDKKKYSEICQFYNLKVLSKEGKVTELFGTDNFDFAIVNNSTAYYEAMYYDSICFRYAPDENEEFQGLDDKFSDLTNLKNNIERFKHSDPDFLNKQVELLLSDVLGMGINRYKKFLLE